MNDNNTIQIENVREGYYWESDKTEPTILNSGDKIERSPSANPFIIEAQYVDNTDVSHAIRYADGCYFEEKTSLREENAVREENVEYDDLIFESHRMNNRKLCFRRYWKAEADELCEGMPVLKFWKMVFVGFGKEK